VTVQPHLRSVTNLTARTPAIVDDADMSSQEQQTKRTAAGVAAAAATIGAVAFALADGEQDHSDAPERTSRDPFDELVAPPSQEQAAAHEAPAETVVDTRPTSERPAAVPHVAAPVAVMPTDTTVVTPTDSPVVPPTDTTVVTPTDATGTDEPAEQVAVDPDVLVVTDLTEMPTSDAVSTAEPSVPTDPNTMADPLGGHSLAINVDFGRDDDLIAPSVPSFPIEPSGNSPLVDILDALQHAELGEPSQPSLPAEPEPAFIADAIAVDPVLPSEYNTIHVTVQAMPEPEPVIEAEPEPAPVYVPAAVNLGILGDPAPSEPLPPRKPLFDPNGPETVVQEGLTFAPTTLPDGTVVGADGHPAAPAPIVPGDTSEWATTSTYEYVEPDFGHHESSMIGLMAGGNLVSIFRTQHERIVIDDDDDQ